MEQPLFRRGGVKKLYNVIHDTKNPLNWFERMRQKQVERPAGLNANLGQVHRTIETRGQAMVAKSGSGDQREVAKLAGMDSVKYYKERSGVLNLARSNTILIRKIREASVPNNSTDAPPDASPEAVVAVIEGGGAGGGGGSPAEALPVVEGVEGEADASSGGGGGGGGGAAASSSSSVVVPEKFEKYEAKITSIPKPTGGGYEDAVASGMSIEERVVKYGPVPGADIRHLVAVALGDIPANPYIAGKAKEYIETELGVEIGSREFFELLKYSATGSTEKISEAEYREARTQLEAAHPSFKEKASGVPKSKKEMDAFLQAHRERAEKELADNILKVNEAVLFDKAFEPIKSTDKTSIRTGFNTLFSEISKAVKLVADKTPEREAFFPKSLEIRKLSNADTIGRLYVDGLSLNEYTNAHKDDPKLLSTIGSIEGIIGLIRNKVLAGEEFEGQVQKIMLQEGFGDLWKAEDFVMDKVYPKLKSVFDSLEKQLTESVKEFRPKGKGGRKPGSKNKKSKAVGALLSGGGGGATSAPAALGGGDGSGGGSEAEGDA